MVPENHRPGGLGGGGGGMSSQPVRDRSRIRGRKDNPCSLREDMAQEKALRAAGMELKSFWLFNLPS